MTTIVEAVIVSIVYFLVRFIEMRFLEKESKPLKWLIKDTLLVFFSVFVGGLLLDQLSPVLKQTGGESISIQNPTVFTDNPAF